MRLRDLGFKVWNWDCAHELWKIIDSWRPNGEKQQQIRDSETRPRKKKKILRFSQIFWDPHFSRYYSMCLMLWAYFSLLHRRTYKKVSSITLFERKYDFMINKGWNRYHTKKKLNWQLQDIDLPMRTNWSWN